MPHAVAIALTLKVTGKAGDFEAAHAVFILNPVVSTGAIFEVQELDLSGLFLSCLHCADATVSQQDLK